MDLAVVLLFICMHIRTELCGFASGLKGNTPCIISSTVESRVYQKLSTIYETSGKD